MSCVRDLHGLGVAAGGLEEEPGAGHAVGREVGGGALQHLT